jgi:hypothetical protein
MVARGYASLSFLHGAADYINSLDVPAYIYHLGDFDPSGVNAGEKIEQTLKELAPDAKIHFQRIGVTSSRSPNGGLSDRPTKTTDSRSKGFGRQCLSSWTLSLPASPQASLKVPSTSTFRPTKLKSLQIIEADERKQLGG